MGVFGDVMGWGLGPIPQPGCPPTPCPGRAHPAHPMATVGVWQAGNLAAGRRRAGGYHRWAVATYQWLAVYVGR